MKSDDTEVRVAMIARQVRLIGCAKHLIMWAD